MATKKCKLHETLKTFCEGKADPLSLEVSSKIQYAKCLQAEEANYHRDCMQHFLSGRSVRESKVNRRNFQEAKNTLFERFCEWYETTVHESSAITLFDVQKWMEKFQGDSNEEVYTFKTVNRKLKVKYGDSLRFTYCEGLPSIMLLHEEADQIVLESSLETVSNSWNVEEDLKDFIFVGREIAQFLQESREREEFYPYPRNLTLENLSALIPKKLSYFLDAIFTKSRRSTAQEKKNLRKFTIAHVIMQK